MSDLPRPNAKVLYRVKVEPYTAEERWNKELSCEVVVVDAPNAPPSGLMTFARDDEKWMANIGERQLIRALLDERAELIEALKDRMKYTSDEFIDPDQDACIDRCKDVIAKAEERTK